MRLDKLLSNMQIGTRSEVKRYIKQGNVKVNGSSRVRPEQQIDPLEQEICCFGKPLTYQKYVYYMFHKPVGCVTARKDQKHKTVMDYIPKSHNDLSPVGRLDLDTEGLLLITNDGALSHDLLSPAKHVKKIYEARIDGIVTEEDAALFAEGVEIGDPTRTKPAKLIIKKSAPVSDVEITITEGRYHQIKRMFQAVGKEVVYLKRIGMGNLKLDETLPPGAYRELTPQELSLLKGQEELYV